MARLPRYLQYLERLPPDRHTVSSDEIAQATGVTAANVRRDLSQVGTAGTRGVGYEVDRLRAHLMRELGLTGDVPVVLVGAGNLGTALANYRGFVGRGFRIAGIYDVDPGKVSRRVGKLEIRHLSRLHEDAAERGYRIGIIATPAEAAQQVAELLAAAGVRSILNFAPTIVRLSDGAVEVRQVDLATELQILSYYLRSQPVHPAAG